MRLKNKLRFGIGFLFLLAIISSGVAIYYLNNLSAGSKTILKNNYRSITYAKNIADALENENITLQSKIKIISAGLINEEANITEIGEAQIVDSIRESFKKYQLSPNNLNHQHKIRKAAYQIMQLNMDAIQRKHYQADKAADDAVFIVSFMAGLCFLAAFSFIWNFPGYIADPVNKNIDSLKQGSDNKTSFIATVSHELKTPIAAIKMSLKLLHDDRVGEINNEQHQLLQNIENDTQRLLHITGELLNAAQAESGNIQLNFASAHPKQLADYAMRAIQSLADQKHIIIKLLCPETLPTVRADLDKATWVLINILSNAVKHSPANSTIDLTIRQLKQPLIEFSVEDHGSGIDQMYLSRIFERYFKVPKADSEKTGTGLGLAIAKDFIEAQGGNISVKSQVGIGSRFYFTLPAII